MVHIWAGESMGCGRGGRGRGGVGSYTCHLSSRAAACSRPAFVEARYLCKHLLYTHIHMKAFVSIRCVALQRAGGGAEAEGLTAASSKSKGETAIYYVLQLHRAWRSIREGHTLRTTARASSGTGTEIKLASQRAYSFFLLTIESHNRGVFPTATTTAHCTTLHQLSADGCPIGKTPFSGSQLNKSVKTRRWECDRPGVEPTSSGLHVWGQYHVPLV